MAVPKKKTSRSKKGKRRSHLGLNPVQTYLCGQCGQPTVPHRVCICGFYANSKVFEAKEES